MRVLFKIITNPEVIFFNPHLVKYTTTYASLFVSKECKLILILEYGIFKEGKSVVKTSYNSNFIRVSL